MEKMLVDVFKQHVVVRVHPNYRSVDAPGSASECMKSCTLGSEVL